jgi:hypothetical protein
MENTRREEAPCAVCGATRFSIDDLGFKFCIYGHQVEVIKTSYTNLSIY